MTPMKSLSIPKFPTGSGTHTPFTLHLTRHLPIQETRTQNTIADPPPAYEYRPCRQPRIG